MNEVEEQQRSKTYLRQEWTTKPKRPSSSLLSSAVSPLRAPNVNRVAVAPEEEKVGANEEKVKNDDGDGGGDGGGQESQQTGGEKEGGEEEVINDDGMKDLPSAFLGERKTSKVSFSKSTSSSFRDFLMGGTYFSSTTSSIMDSPNTAHDSAPVSPAGDGGGAADANGGSVPKTLAQLSSLSYTPPSSPQPPLWLQWVKYGYLRCGWWLKHNVTSQTWFEAFVMGCIVLGESR